MSTFTRRATARAIALLIPFAGILAAAQSNAATDPGSDMTYALVAPADAAPVQAGIAGFLAVPKPPENLVDPADVQGPTYDVNAFYGSGGYLGVNDNGLHLYSAIRSAFGNFTFGGFRPCPAEGVCLDPEGHPAGKAIDTMVSDKDLGDRIAKFVATHADLFGVRYVIWRQRIWNAGQDGAGDPGSWTLMADRGSVTENHFDHVHVSFH